MLVTVYVHVLLLVYVHTPAIINWHVPVIVYVRELKLELISGSVAVTVVTEVPKIKIYTVNSTNNESILLTHTYKTIGLTIFSTDTH